MDKICKDLCKYVRRYVQILLCYYKYLKWIPLPSRAVEIHTVHWPVTPELIHFFRTYMGDKDQKWNKVDMHLKWLKVRS